MVDIQKRIIDDIFALFSKEHLLSENNIYEEFNIINRVQHIERLVNSNIISKQAEPALLVSLAIMYANMCMIYAKSNLSLEEYQNFMVLFRLMDFDDGGNSFWVEIFYTRHADQIQLVRESDKIAIQNCALFEQINHVVGLSDFNCFYFKNCESEERYYSFVPKCLCSFK